jgi:hypothetical protein
MQGTCPSPYLTPSQPYYPKISNPIVYVHNHEVSHLLTPQPFFSWASYISFILMVPNFRLICLVSGPHTATSAFNHLVKLQCKLIKATGHHRLQAGTSESSHYIVAESKAAGQTALQASQSNWSNCIVARSGNWSNCIAGQSKQLVNFHGGPVTATGQTALAGWNARLAAANLAPAWPLIWKRAAWPLRAITT